jgi:triphosphoribosyl-dephospho-CoA synthase
VQAFFATMAVLDDTNTAHRGGWEGVQFVKASAQVFLDAGGVAQTDWLRQARAIHAEFVARRLSPGGAADVLAAACWLQELQQHANASAEVIADRTRQAAAKGAPHAAPSALLASVWAA